MDQLEKSTHAFRKARTRSLISLGGLVYKSGLVDTFGITLGEDLQRSLHQKLPVAGLFKALSELNKLANSDDVHIPLWQIQGLELLANEKREK
jgi:hypothetical protein